MNGYFLSIQFRLNNKKTPSLKLLLVIERKHRSTPKSCSVKYGLLEASKNFFMLELHDVDFKLLDGNEKNIFPLRAAAQLSEYCKIGSNYKAHQQLM